MEQKIVRAKGFFEIDNKVLIKRGQFIKIDGISRSNKQLGYVFNNISKDFAFNSDGFDLLPSLQELNEYKEKISIPELTR